jgi:transcriptional regulator with XRE-family HTH domain
MDGRQYDHHRLKRLRERAGLTQTELAQRVNVTLMTIYRVESGRNCSLQLLHRLAAELGVAWKSLLRSEAVEVGEKPPVARIYS